MACEIVVHGSVILLVWGTPEVRDLVRAEGVLNNVYERCGPVVMISRVPHRSKAPDEHFRRALVDMIPRFMKQVTSFHAVLEGRGFFAAAKRTVLATAFLMSGERHQYRIHAEIDEVPLAVAPARRPEVHAAVMYFQRHGHCLHSLYPTAASTAP